MKKCFDFSILKGNVSPLIFKTDNWDINDEESADLLGHESCDFSMTPQNYIQIDSFNDDLFWSSTPQLRKSIMDNSDYTEFILVSCKDETLWIRVTSGDFQTWMKNNTHK